MVNGTAYEITGGKTLVDGTSYSVKHGKVLVGGTEYDISFTKYVHLTVSGYYSDTRAYYMLDGVAQAGTNGAYNVDTQIEQTQSLSVYIKYLNSSGTIELNGQTVKTGSPITYTIDITACSEVFIDFITFSGMPRICRITVS